MAPRIGHIFKPLRERLEDKIYPDPNTGCLLWGGATNGAGYGRIRIALGVNVYAHRSMYELHRGPIPEGMQLDHLCRTPACVNPNHLEPVTNRENARRGLAGSHNSTRTHCVRGHPFADHGYIESRGGRQCRLCLHIRQRAYRARKRDKDV